MTTPLDNDQTTRWKVAGNAWVDAQDLITTVLQPFQDILVELAKDTAAQRVLDVGCGTGGTTLAVAREAGARCTGVDIAEPMIDAARANTESEGLPVDFVCADAQTHPFEPATYDLVMSRFGVMFFADPVAAFTNLRRATVPGGRLGCLVWRGMDENPYFTVAERIAAPLLPNLAPRIPGAPGQFAFADRERVTEILESSGWTDIDVRPVDAVCAMPEPALIGYISRLGPVGIALLDADEATREKVIADVRTAMEPFIDGDQARFTGACWMLDARAPESA
ncbi:class I SAM-dependent methyltransferase [Nocardia seriolae]|uniref:class I SAM-dependent methyltransferase n=1 Tax=Nocardia seriolae TaxID=37332 RepID=UPI0008FF6A6C|nr:class I SAM-dependent methyltransferase [Nocardia seriolae]OJF82336.1 SAM-dependent methyltransferase [Nocardia seriolae]PSK29878.1 class I SAM-dependent methyltransferase [Nocardia seriolae]QOW33085.1 class I SAM-dependent methyltransferase [Nocardia seriolae]QUN14677.1 class I SAM-dependent methyltransferase [Nocardia seriolae]WNJ60726.1 class I SAM-dependent methyltransferase [Nocardia seriolae]